MVPFKSNIGGSVPSSLPDFGVFSNVVTPVCWPQRILTLVVHQSNICVDIPIAITTILECMNNGTSHVNVSVDIPIPNWLHDYSSTLCPRIPPCLAADNTPSCATCKEQIIEQLILTSRRNRMGLMEPSLLPICEGSDCHATHYSVGNTLTIYSPTVELLVDCISVRAITSF